MFINESRARTAEHCLRSYYWFYRHGGHGVASRYPDDRLVWGQLIHAGLAAHYSEQSATQAISAALAEAFPNFTSEDFAFKNKWLAETARIERIVNHYVEWAAPRDSFTVYGVEQSGSVRLGDSCWRCGASHVREQVVPDYRPDYTPNEQNIRCGVCGAERHWFVFRLDLLVRTDYGLEVWDHKSTEASIDAKYLSRWNNSYQMWGYCFGAERMSGLPVGGYTVNIIRKVKAAEAAPDMTRCCPDCKNGKIKRLSCSLCNSTGRVPRDERPADTPFVRWSGTYGPRQRDSFVEARVRLATKLTEHQQRFDDGDLTAFPHNPSSFSCPEMCHQKPEVDLRSVWVNDEKYLTKGPDYVTLKRMVAEEAV